MAEKGVKRRENVTKPDEIVPDMILSELGSKLPPVRPLLQTFPREKRCFSPGGTAHYKSVWGVGEAWEVGHVAGSDLNITQERGMPEKFFGMHYERTIKIPAGKDFSFYMEGLMYGGYLKRYCGMMPVFLPQAGSEYEVRYLADGTTCNIEILELNVNDLSVTKVDPRYLPKCAK